MENVVSTKLILFLSIMIISLGEPILYGGLGYVVSLAQVLKRIPGISEFRIYKADKHIGADCLEVRKVQDSRMQCARLAQSANEAPVYKEGYSLASDVFGIPRTTSSFP